MSLKARPNQLGGSQVPASEARRSNDVFRDTFKRAGWEEEAGQGA